MPESDPPTPFWSGTISFGLVTIPVSLYAATRNNRDLALRQLAPDGAALRREYICPVHQQPLEREEIVRAYERDDGEFVVITDDELEALAPEASRDIELKQFVDRAALSPLLFDRAYFLLPSSDSTKPYRLLTQVLEERERAGIATLVMRGRQHTVAIVAQDQLLRAQTLRFASELRTPEALGLPSPPEQVDLALVERLRAAIREHSEPDIDRAELDDDTRARVIALAERKLAEGRDRIDPPSAESGDPSSGEAEIVDLIDVLARSLARPA